MSENGWIRAKEKLSIAAPGEVMGEIKNPNPPERYWYVEKSRIVYEGEWYFDTEEEAKAKATEVHGKYFPPEKDWQRYVRKPKQSLPVPPCGDRGIA